MVTKYDDGRFLTVRNFDQLAPGWTRNRPLPWPTDDPATTLIWFADNGAQLWVPTPEERDAEFVRAFPDAEKPKRQSLHVVG